MKGARNDVYGGVMSVFLVRDAKQLKGYFCNECACAYLIKHFVVQVRVPACLDWTTRSPEVREGKETLP